MNIDQKVAVITGGNSGIGFALAKKLLQENYQVIVTSRSGKIEDFTHPNLNVVQLEITDLSSIKNCVKEILKIADQIHLLVNNAGIADDIQHIIPEYNSFKRTLDVNVTGLTFFAEEILSYVVEGGQIINVSSEMGLLSQAMANAPAYRISKAAVNMYTKLLSLRLVEKDILVSAIHPGWVQTKLGGDMAPLTPDYSANGIYNIIRKTRKTGQFSNIVNEESFVL